MKLDPRTPILDFDGRPLWQDDKGTVPMTVRFALRNALGTFLQNDNATGEEKLRRYEIGLKLRADEVDLESGDIQICKNVVALCYSPLVAGDRKSVV